jgi:hypothetical protein
MTKNQKNKRNSEPRVMNLDPNPKGEWKGIAGADHDEWNLRQTSLVLAALPWKRDDDSDKAVISGMLDMKPCDPIEGMLIGQIMAANEAATRLYRLGWLNIEKYPEAGTKYLQQADKSARTAAMLIERLDSHRGRGQQQIVVKHVTVNADQAMVADSIVTDKTNDALSAAKLLPAPIDQPTLNIELSHKEALPIEGGSKQK